MFPDLNPLDPNQRELLQKGLGSLRPEQLLWLSGYLSGRASGFLPQNDQAMLPTGAPGSVDLGTLTAGAPASAPAKPLELLVLYGTESGNSEGLADQFNKRAKKAGFKPTLKNMSDISPADLKKHQNIITIVSTWGDGEPPESAEAFHTAFMGEELDLKGVNFTVLALGDTSYEKFCQTGKDFDTRFEKLGATRIVDRQDCDIDFDDDFASWSGAAFAKLEELKPVAESAPANCADTPTTDTEFTYVASFDKTNPFPAEVIANINLNGTGSSKETIHLELSLEDSGLIYEVGDALAVIPENAEDVVIDFLTSSGFSGEEQVEIKKIGITSLKEALTKHLDITALSKKILKSYQELTGSNVLADLLTEDRKEDLKDFLWGREISDLFNIVPFSGTAQDFVSILR